VEKGWQERNEVNRVVYDPNRVSVEEMEGLLRKAGTYIRTLTEEKPESGRDGKRNGG